MQNIVDNVYNELKVAYFIKKNAWERDVLGIH